MNRHGIKTTRRTISFLSFKGDAKESTLDQVTLPPEAGLDEKMWHRFGEWLKRMGKGWEYASEEAICEWSVDYWNASLSSHELPRRFDRIATTEDLEAAGVAQCPKSRQR
jgi:hypothetical protein